MKGGPPIFEVKSMDRFGLLIWGVLLAYFPVPAFFYFMKPTFEFYSESKRTPPGCCMTLEAVGALPYEIS
jgi:hypothetical protein